LLLNLVDVSAWQDNEAGAALAAATPATRRSANYAEGYQLDLPYPFLLEPEGRPWFQSWQILEPGLKDGVGTASESMYRLLLRGGEITHAYNAACRKEHGTFTDRAVELRRVAKDVAAQKEAYPDEFAAVAEYGVTWASDGFRDLLAGAVEEAHAYAVSCRVGVTPTLDTLATIVKPVARYDRACRRLGIPTTSPVVAHAAKRAYQALATYIVAKKMAPWHSDRSSVRDAETAQIIRFCAKQKGVDLSAIKTPMTAFLRMVELNSASKAPAVDVHQQMLDWSTHNLE
jgi:hypothetical protein